LDGGSSTVVKEAVTGVFYLSKRKIVWGVNPYMQPCILFSFALGSM